MNTREILKKLTIGVMLCLGIGFLLFPFKVGLIPIQIAGFLFFCLGMRSVFYELDKKKKFWRKLDLYIYKKMLRKEEKEK